MPSQLLVNVITATVPASAVNYAVAHGLRSNDKAVAPTLVLPQGQSAVLVVSADETNVYLNNSSGADVAVTLRCERDLSMQADAASVTPFYMSTGAPGGGVETLFVTAPITNTGTAEAPIIGATVGSTPGTVCAGNDARLSDERVPLNNSVTTAKVATANKDGAAATPSMRTLGTGSNQACAGNDSRLRFSETLDARITGGSGNFGSSNTVEFPLSGGPYNVTLTQGKLITMSAYTTSGWVDNATASIVLANVKITHGSSGGNLADVYFYVPANSRVIIPQILRVLVWDLPTTTYTDVRFSLKAFSMNASITYSLPTPINGDITIISQG